MSSGKCKLKQRDSTTHLLQNGQNPEYQQHQMLMMMWSNRNSHTLLVKLQNGAATLEFSLAVSYKTKHTLTIQSSNCAPWYLPKGVENLCPHKNLHMDVYSKFIHNFQNLEATKMFSEGEWINCVTSRQWSIIQH